MSGLRCDEDGQGKRMRPVDSGLPSSGPASTISLRLRIGGWRAPILIPAAVFASGHSTVCGRIALWSDRQVERDAVYAITARRPQGHL